MNRLFIEILNTYCKTYVFILKMYLFNEIFLSVKYTQSYILEFSYRKR